MRCDGPLLAAFLFALWAARAQAAPPRLLYTGDWSGTRQVHDADPSGVRATAEITFGRAPACARAACGYH